MINQLRELVSTNVEVNGILLLGMVVIAIFWLTMITLLLWRQIKMNNALLDGEHSRSLKEIVIEQMNKVGSMHVELANLETRLLDIRRTYIDSIQKVGLVRFSPFDDTGSDQSFSLALLDGNDSGVIISALHGRDRTRMYAKKVTQGNSKEYALSQEEQEAIKQAIASFSASKK
jgi:hypothetical protein